MGNIRRDQLIALGVGRRAIDHWLARGRIVARHRGVYALGHTSLPAFSREFAALLACGEQAILSHASAAYLWAVRPEPETDVVDVTLLGRHIRSRSDVRIHSPSQLDPSDITREQEIPVTSPARTLIDLAQELDDWALERAVHEALAIGILAMPELRRALERYPRRRGTARLAEIAAQGRSSRTRSGGEEALLKLIRRSGLPQPQLNVRVGRWEIDFLWPEFALAVEVDGFDFHRSRWSIERDRRKELDCRIRGIDLLRFSGRQVTRQPEMTLATIARAMPSGLRPRQTES